MIAELPRFPSTPPCAKGDPDLYFPDQGDPDRQRHLAVTLCASCPFTAPCLEYALQHNVSGIWAGTSRHERKEMRRTLGIRALELSADRRVNVALIDQLTAAGLGPNEIARRTGVTQRTVLRRRRELRARLEAAS